MKKILFFFFLYIIFATSFLNAGKYKRETINKHSFVTETLGGIDNANKIREFRDEVLLKSETGLKYTEAFYKVLSDVAYVLLRDKNFYNNVNGFTTNFSNEIDDIIDKHHIPLEYSSAINTIIENYVNSDYSKDEFKNLLTQLVKDYPIEDFIENYNNKQLKSTSKTFVKYKKDSILIKFKSNVSKEEIKRVLSKYGLYIDEFYKEISVYKIKALNKKNIKNLVSTLDNLSFVEYAQIDGIVTANNFPNDPYFEKLWGLNNEGQTGGTYDADIDMLKAWDKTTGSKKVIVAVIDTGVNYNHADLKSNMWINRKEIPNNGIDDDHNGYIDDYRGWDFVNNDNNPMDDHNHGTHCSGTIGAIGDNGVGVTGVNWKVSIMPLKFLDSCGIGTDSNAIKAILYSAKMGAKISSNSWGGSTYNKALYDAIKYFRSKGGLFVAAAGNKGRNNDKKPSYPASYNLDNIISVAATDHNDKLASFSNYGVKSVDLAAPGVKILSTVIHGYKYFDGTSMATPHVAGVAALVKSIYPHDSYTQLKNRLLKSVDKLDSLKGKVLTGGRLNATRALGMSPNDLNLIPIYYLLLLQNN